MTRQPIQRSALRSALLALGAAALLAAPVAAQEPLTGLVVDPAGKPVGNQRVTLHMVTQQSGAMVDSAMSDAQGRFTVHVPAVQDTSTIFFVATRWKGDLFIGTPFRPPLPAGVTYSVTVGVNPVQMGPAGGGMGGGAAAAPSAATAPASSSNTTRWFIVVMLGLVALGAAGYALLGAARERGEQRRRELLLRIAELDERVTTSGGAELAELRRERAELLAQLAGD